MTCLEREERESVKPGQHFSQRIFEGFAKGGDNHFLHDPNVGAENRADTTAQQTAQENAPTTTPPTTQHSTLTSYVSMLFNLCNGCREPGFFACLYELRAHILGQKV